MQRTIVKDQAGKGLSENDYTSAEKAKLAAIEVGAQVNDTAAQIRDKLAGLAGDSRLDASAIKGLTGGDGVGLELVDVPAAFDSAGAANQIAIDGDYLYVYVAGSGWGQVGPITFNW